MACVELASSAAQKVNLSTSTLLRKLGHDAALWNTVLGDLRASEYKDVLHLTYADLARSPLDNMQEIYRFLGVDSTYTPIINETLKMHTSLRNSIANLASVEKVLQGTPWLQELEPT